MNKRKILTLALICFIAIIGYVIVVNFVDFTSFSNADAIKKTVTEFGALGPIILIIMMVVAVVFCPIPSAPIAMAAGAIFGQFIGAVYVVIGAELGALIAFVLARLLGRDLIHKWFGDKVDSGLLGSQNTLMFVVFASRLMPFVSFDLMSYAAGLSALKFWRFALATFAGIIPASLFLTHFGGVLVSSSGSGIIWASFIFGAITGVPLLYLAWRNRVAAYTKK